MPSFSPIILQIFQNWSKMVKIGDFNGLFRYNFITNIQFIELILGKNRTFIVIISIFIGKKQYISGNF